MDEESEAETPESRESQPSKEASPKTGKEPCWPLLVGSIVPALAIIGYFYLLWTVASGAAIQIEIPFSAGITKAISTVVVWFGIVALIYCVIAFFLDFLAIWGFARRSLRGNLALTYSLRAWKLTGFLTVFAGLMFIIYSTQMWLASVLIFWLALILSFVIAIFLGAAILELVHKVNVSKKLFFVFMLTEFVAYIASGYAATMLFIVAPK